MPRCHDTEPQLYPAGDVMVRCLLHENVKGQAHV
jgi:hypothetical protein